MQKLFGIIDSLKTALVGLLAAVFCGLIVLWMPLSLPVTIPLLIPLIYVGGFCLAYVCVHGLWPASVPYLKKGIGWSRTVLSSKLNLGKPESFQELSYLPASRSVDLFSQRFAQAFPGVRETAWYEQQEGVKRLSAMLREPLVFKGDSGETKPIWWWRGGNLQISKFKVLSKNKVLLNDMELDISKIAAVPSAHADRSFVYLEANPMKPTGLYNSTEDEVQHFTSAWGYFKEEYGLFKNKHLVSRSEYEDNAAIIHGKLVALDENVELRARHITPYNIIIAPHASVINNNSFDKKLEEFMNDMLKGNENLETLEEMVKQLPKHRLYSDGNPLTVASRGPRS